MKILVINCGSSSLKYQLLDMQTEEVLCKGNCERVGLDDSFVTHKAHGKEWRVDCDFPTHTEAFMKVVLLMTDDEFAVIKSKSEIDAIGHRVVQGAEIFTKSEIVTDEIIKQIDDVSHLAPVHNPAHVKGLNSAKAVFGENVPNVAVFDTTFHQTMPPKAYMYAIPYELYEKYSIRRYGFHGTSHRYVSLKAAEFLGKSRDELKIITCHLGNGSSIAAIDHGKCVDTSMGLTPLAGLIMGTRCGDIDPSAVTFIEEKTGLSGQEMANYLNKKCGLLGVSGVSSDKRDVEKAANEGNERAQLAREMLQYQIKKYVGSYAAAMGGVDCIVFTGGIGENAPNTRAGVCENMEFLGVNFSAQENEKGLQGRDMFSVSTPDSKVKVLVICTNEELMIARDTQKLVLEMKA